MSQLLKGLCLALVAVLAVARVRSPELSELPAPAPEAPALSPPAVASMAAIFAPQQRGQGRVYPNVPYDGRFQLVRLRYIEYQGNGWWYDYPDMEEHLMTMIDELTKVRVARKGSNIFTLDDPELTRWPVAYLSEPGYWYVNDVEAAGLRAYLKKGGFLVVDDFYAGSRQNEWGVFYQAMMKVLPDAKLIRLDVKNPIYDAFYRIATLQDFPHPQGGPYIKAEFYGIFEDNDPKKRMMVVINYNTDLGDFMEWSGTGLWPVNLSNDAYKMMMNYIMYGLVF